MRALIVLAFLALVAGRAVADDAPQVTKPPKLAHFVEAVRPPGTEDRSAVVVLAIDITETGQVGDVRVTQSAGAELDAAALAAARQFVFEPAEIDGQPGPVTITYSYKFTIEEKVVSLGPQINFEGLVVERFKKTPIAGVKIVVKDVGVEALTDEHGAFAFTDLPVGTHPIELSGTGLITVTTEEEIQAKQKRTVKYFAELREEGVDEEEVIHATRIKKETASVSIRTEEARKVPGTQGDTLKVVQNLPGV
ncbi:MAG TPA: TonB family protein, partial [Kofleriaceae bacterium]|nr:TonB family protein [Kofleriaceae bacterium]